MTSQDLRFAARSIAVVGHNDLPGTCRGVRAVCVGERNARPRFSAEDDKQDNHHIQCDEEHRNHDDDFPSHILVHDGTGMGVVKLRATPVVILVCVASLMRYDEAVQGGISFVLTNHLNEPRPGI